MISLLSIVPLRREPSETSEMVSQILFGESYDVLETADNWTKVQMTHDGYEGWVDTKMIFIGESIEKPCVVTSHQALLSCGDDVYTVVLGSVLPCPKNGEFTLANKKHKWLQGEYSSQYLQIDGALELIQTLKNAPYLWGGRTPFGIDCSGLSQLFYRLMGKTIPRDASQQIDLGHEIFLIESEPGDLAFFEKNGKVTHVGILLDSQTIIHASGWVRVDTIDASGIFIDKKTGYSHHLVGVRRLI